MEEALKYFEKLRKLINNPPEGYGVRYDYMSNELYVFDKTAKFIDDTPVVKNTGSEIGVSSIDKQMGYTTEDGYERSKIIGSVFVDMEAKQQ